MRDGDPKQDWFEVFIDTDAKLIAPGPTETDAIQSVIEYCNSNRYLGLDPEMLLPHGVWGKPLEAITGQMYSHINARTGVEQVRLVDDNRKLPNALNQSRHTEIAVHENQLCLFTLQKFFNHDYRYSYFPD